MNGHSADQGVVRRWLGSHPFQPLVLVLSLLPLASSIVAGAVIWRYGAHEPDFGWSVTRSAPRVIDAVDPDGPAAGRLELGDRLIALNNDQRVTLLGTAWKQRTLRPGDPYALDVERRGAILHVTLNWRLKDADRRWALALWVVVGLVWSGFGVFIGLARPSVPAARLWALAALSTGVNFIRLGIHPLLTQVGSVPAAVCAVLELNAPFVTPLVYQAVYRFPPGIPSGRFWSAALAGVYAAGTFGLTWVLSTAGVYVLGPQRAAAMARAMAEAGIGRELFSITSAAILILIGAVAVRNFRRVDNADQRRRVRWIVIACAVAIVPEAVVEFVHGTSVEVAADLFSMVVPAAFAYAIVQHRVFDITVAIRLGIQYVLARNALRVAIGLPIAAMAYLIASNPQLTVAQLALDHPVYPVLGGAAAGALAVRRRLASAIDRRFFREAYDRERLLQSLLDDVDSLYTDEEGLQRIAERLQSALHPVRLMVWFPEHDRSRMRLVLVRSAAAVPELEPWNLSPELLHALEERGVPLRIASDRDGVLAPDTLRYADRFGIEVLVPMVGHDDRLRGLLGLGPKRAEEPYTPGELHMLQRIARQLASVKEHVELRALVVREQAVRQDVLGRLESSGLKLLKECPACGACYDGEYDRCERDGSELVLSLPVERTLVDRYRLDRLIGRGGMGAVYDAFDLNLRRAVAVKVMLGRSFGNDAALRRFDREARAVARLNHPNIVAVFDYGHLPGEGAFLVMERIQGHTLRAALAEHRVHPPPESREWIAEMLDGIGAAHAEGVTHRDLKPENVFVIPPGEGAVRIKLLDFGLARLRTSAADETLSTTAPGLVLGTAAYMAPEQMLGREVDQRADIFALGIIVFEILTGRRPFAADPLQRLRDIEDGITSSMIPDENVRAALARCVALDPDRRYSTVDAARSHLLAAISCLAQRPGEPSAGEEPTG